MRETVRIVAVVALLSVLSTMWLVLASLMHGDMNRLLDSRLWGPLSVAGLLITLIAGPVAVIQLWRLRESGRRAGIVLFGYDLAYSVIGLIAMRALEGATWAAVGFGIPLAVLLAPQTKAVVSRGRDVSRAA